MKCSNCLDNLIWGGDHSYTDYGLEEEGIVSNYTCANEECDVSTIIIYLEINEKT